MKNSHLFLIGLALMVSGALGFIFSWYYSRPVTINDEMPLIHNPVKMLCQLEHDPEAGKKIF